MAKIIYNAFQMKEFGIDTEVVRVNAKNSKGIFEYCLDDNQKKQFNEVEIYINKYQQARELELIDFVMDFLITTGHLLK